tara:strand:- start:346 stop:513 length:168 start_codon:yes stop_codon:yes gene_type:complete
VKKIDIVITVYDNTKKICPIFPCNDKRIHRSIKDPFKGWSSNPDDLVNFTLTRDD